MMICPNCKKEVRDGLKFCTNCGQDLTAISQDSVISQDEDLHVEKTKEKKKKGRWIKVALILFLLILALGAGGYFYMREYYKNKTLDELDIPFKAEYKDETIDVEYGINITPDFFLEDNKLSITFEPENIDTTSNEDIEIVYTIKGEAMLNGEVSKKISKIIHIVDSMPPVISGNAINLQVGDNYSVDDLNISVVDNKDGNVGKFDAAQDQGAWYIVEGDVDANSEGKYTVKVSAGDSSGNKSEKEFEVNVSDSKGNKSEEETNASDSREIVFDFIVENMPIMYESYIKGTSNDDMESIVHITDKMLNWFLTHHIYPTPWKFVSKEIYIDKNSLGIATNSDGTITANFVMKGINDCTTVQTGVTDINELFLKVYMDIDLTTGDWAVDSWEVLDGYNVDVNEMVKAK